ncbi:MAG: WG repeat-containing protein [Bryobacteraceae bacterium]|nr:WG repeat-containing protein [Bryobacteraceae bacterium]
MIWFNLLLLAALAADSPLYPIREGRQFGFIDRTGKVVIAPRFDRVAGFREGLAAVWVGSQGGYINPAGETVIQPQYSTLTDFEEGRALVSKDGKYSVIDAKGKLVADIPYRVLGDYSAGLAVVQRAREGATPSAYGYIDRNGKVVIEPKFMPAGKFPADGKGLAAVGFERQWCYIDRAGNIVLRLPMEGRDRADGFRDGLLRWKEGFYWGYRDPRGEWAIKPRFDEAQDFERGRARVMLEGKWILIDAQGNPLDEPKGPIPIAEPSEGLTLAAEGPRLGYLDAGGKPAFPLRVYDEAHDFSCGRARIKLDGRFGYLDSAGNLAIPNQYYGAADFKDCLASVMTPDGWAYIDPAGKTVWKSSAK